MGSDLLLVLRWWGTLFLVGAAAYPLTKALFSRAAPGSGLKEPQGLTPPSWWDRGYFFSKAVGMATVTWVVYVLGSVRVMPFGIASITTSLILVFILGLVLLLVNYESGIRNYGEHKHKTVIHYSLFIIQVKKHWKQIAIVLVEELFFLVALVFWSWIKAHEPSIRGLEKFMDFGFMKSILNSQFFPPADMWYPPFPINYYYFGHMVTAVLTKLSGLDLAYTFNLMLASLFALTTTMSFSIGAQLFLLSIRSRPEKYESGIMNYGERKRKIIIHDSLFMILSGTLTAFLVTLAGNMQTIYAFTRGYIGDPPAGGVEPFWRIAWPLKELWQKLPEGLNTYWYANATRFIPLTIHEFPSYSFVVSDVHGHVLSIPFVLLAIGLLITIWGSKGDRRSWGKFMFYGFLVGALLMTNALDGPIYFALLLAVLGVSMYHRVNVSVQNKWKEFAVIIGGVLIAAIITALPFLLHFKSFVSGVAVNCPPAFLANTKIGPILFEEVEKCQRSPLWMMWLLWGFFWFCGAGLLASMRQRVSASVKNNKIELLLIIFFLFSLALIIFPEFFYFKDIYPAHFRSNTMFKLGYDAFILFSIVAGYTIVSLSLRGAPIEVEGRRGNLLLETNKRLLRPAGGRGLARTVFLIFLIPQLFLVSIYPIFSVRSYFNGLRRYEGLNGLTWLAREYPSDYLAIQWLNSQAQSFQRYALVEADGDSYTDYARFSAFIGIPTIIGWPVHEWLWRGTYDVVAPRREDVRMIYESEDLELTRAALVSYGVRYVVVGELERQKYPELAEWKFGQLGEVAFQNGQTTIYQVDLK